MPSGVAAPCLSSGPVPSMGGGSPLDRKVVSRTALVLGAVGVVRCERRACHRVRCWRRARGRDGGMAVGSCSVMYPWSVGRRLCASRMSPLVAGRSGAGERSRCALLRRRRGVGWWVMCPSHVTFFRGPLLPVDMAGLRVVWRCAGGPPLLDVAGGPGFVSPCLVRCRHGSVSGFWFAGPEACVPP